VLLQIPPEDVQPVIDGYNFKSVVEGEQTVNTTLRLLNDVLRIGYHLPGLSNKFPFIEFFSSITELPEVLVEFKSSFIQEVGRLRIIDAPGLLIRRLMFLPVVDANTVFFIVKDQMNVLFHTSCNST